jgi:hypothetical protein
MKKIFVFLLLTLTMKSFAQIYEDPSAEYETPEFYTQELDDTPYLEPVEYPEEYLADDRDYEQEAEYYEEL